MLHSRLCVLGAFFALALLAACGSDEAPVFIIGDTGGGGGADAGDGSGDPADSGETDAGGNDAAQPDAGDAGGSDGGDTDGGPSDAGDSDAGADELCDNGVDDDGDGDVDCTDADCVGEPICDEPFCGDGTLDEGEECDDGAANSDVRPDACREDCVLPTCGDGVIDADEDCDEGDENGFGRCNLACQVTPVCGDRITDAPEQCDDGNDDPDDGCDGCRLTDDPACGDGFYTPGAEECDNGQGCGLDGECLPTCECAFFECGDGEAQGIEECDGDDLRDCSAGERCTLECFCEAIPVEDCDNGVDDDGDGDADCDDFDCAEDVACVPECGDGVVEAPEECEEDSDCGLGLVCTSCACVAAPPENCGNGVDDDRDGDADCDDLDCAGAPNCADCGDNVASGAEECDGADDDACTSDEYCTAGCACAPIPDEQCDNGVDDDFDGDTDCDDPDCDGSVACDPECGNGEVETGEECDAGPNNSDTIADRCRTDCTLPVCGDDVADSGEACDGEDDLACGFSESCSPGCFCVGSEGPPVLDPFSLNPTAGPDPEVVLHPNFTDDFCLGGNAHGYEITLSGTTSAPITSVEIQREGVDEGFGILEIEPTTTGAFEETVELCFGSLEESTRHTIAVVDDEGRRSNEVSFTLPRLGSANVSTVEAFGGRQGELVLAVTGLAADRNLRVGEADLRGGANGLTESTGFATNAVYRGGSYFGAIPVFAPDPATSGGSVTVETWGGSRSTARSATFGVPSAGAFGADCVPSPIGVVPTCNVNLWCNSTDDTNVGTCRSAIGSAPTIDPIVDTNRFFFEGCTAPNDQLLLFVMSGNASVPVTDFEITIPGLLDDPVAVGVDPTRLRDGRYEQIGLLCVGADLVGETFVIRPIDEAGQAAAATRSFIAP